MKMTHSWRHFGQPAREVSRLIQTNVRKQLGLYTTVGIGDSPTQAKLVLDVYAKHTADFIGEIHYGTILQRI
ncbi:hypothetical protein AZI11_13270 (plasmid) [Levilactobacillus brevis]|nr:hypothetical protein AZI11_13270 [Levilactobacillus brevis]ARN96439.1 hypothetical protein AZI12_13145 [Levilactobacillus brevis]